MEFAKRRELIEQLLNQAILLAKTKDIEITALLNNANKCHLSRDGDDAVIHCLNGIRELLFDGDGPFSKHN